MVPGAKVPDRNASVGSPPTEYLLLAIKSPGERCPAGQRISPKMFQDNERLRVLVGSCTIAVTRYSLEGECDHLDLVICWVLSRNNTVTAKRARIHTDF
jgi:hypothetical protein